MATSLTGYSIQRNEIFDIMHSHQREGYWGNGKRNTFYLRTDPNTKLPKWSVRIGDITNAKQLFQCTHTDTDGNKKGVDLYTQDSCEAGTGNTWDGSVTPANKYEFVFNQEGTDINTENKYGKIIVGIENSTNVDEVVQQTERLVVRYTENNTLGDGGMLFQLATDMCKNPYGEPDRFPGTADDNGQFGQSVFVLGSTEMNIKVSIRRIKDTNGDLLANPVSTPIEELPEDDANRVANTQYYTHTQANGLAIPEPTITFYDSDMLPTYMDEVVVEYSPAFAKKAGFKLIYPNATSMAKTHPTLDALELDNRLDAIENLVVVESWGCDVLSDNTSISTSLKRPSGSGYGTQSWRIRMYYDYTEDELQVNVGTKYQILDNGNITKTQDRDGIATKIYRTPGEMCDIYHVAQAGKTGTSDINLNTQKAKSGFFRRVGKITDEYSSTYPLSYRLTVTDHGVGFFLWDQASVEQEDDYAWFVIQRHVDNQSGEVDWGDQVGNQSPVHCIYSPYKRPVDLNSLPAFFSTNTLGDNTKLEDIFDNFGTRYESDRAAASTNYRFDGLTTIVDLAGGDPYGHFDDGSGADRRVDAIADRYGNIFTIPTQSEVTAGNIETWDIVSPNYSSGTSQTSGSVTTPTLSGSGTSAPDEYDINRPPKITNREILNNTMIVALNGVEIERAGSGSYIEVTADTSGNLVHRPVWDDDDEFSGTTYNSYIYDEEFHVLHFRHEPGNGAELVVKYNTYTTMNPDETYYVEIPEDPEMPEHNLNNHKESKAIYRFVVRESDVFKPWDIHKSATMHTKDSNAIINPLEQLGITSDRNFVFSFPTQITTQRFYYPTSELDIIAYSSADFSTFGGRIEIDKYADSNGDESILSDEILDSGGNETGIGKYFDPDTGLYKKVDLMLETDAAYSSFKTSALRYRTGKKRVYEGMMSTLPFGNGMRLFMHVNGSSIADSDVPDGKFN